MTETQIACISLYPDVEGATLGDSKEDDTKVDPASLLSVSAMADDADQLTHVRVDIADLDPEAKNLRDEKPTLAESEWLPSREQLSTFHRAHSYMSHPTTCSFARVLRLGDAKPEVWRLVEKTFVCPDCQAETRLHARNPSAVPKIFASTTFLDSNW